MLFRPTPIIEWYYNGRRISRNNFDYTISQAGNKLTIRNARERYAGKYKCDISNSQGRVSSEGSLSVRGKSFFILFFITSVHNFLDFFISGSKLGQNLFYKHVSV